MRSNLIYIFKSIWFVFEFTKISNLLWKFLAKFSSPVVICYHRISEERLVKQLEILRRFFKIGDLNSLLDDIFVKNKKIISHKIAITMDDCYRSDFLIAAKVFDKTYTPCTFFIPTSYSQKRIVLWAKKLIFLSEFIDDIYIDIEGNQIVFKDKLEKKMFFDGLMNFYLWNDMQTKDIEEEVDRICFKNKFNIPKEDIIIGVDDIKNYAVNNLFNFQSHTKSHPKLILCNEDELIDEFKSSKYFLRDIVKIPQNIICYPYGSKWHISESYQIAKRYFDYGLSLELGSLSKKENRMMIPRLPLYEKDTAASIFLKIVLSQI